MTNVSEELRIFACDIIQRAGILLRLPQVAVATAQMLLHRAYHTSEYANGRHYLDITSMAALFLASKIEEYPRKARELIDVFVFVINEELQRDVPERMRRDIRLSYVEHEKARQELITAERRMLKTLGFNLLSSYPHKILVNYYHAVVHALDPEHNVWRERDNQRLLQRAWNYCNDGLRLDIFIRYSKEVVACACIQMACVDRNMLFPKSTDGREWYCLFVEAEEDVLKSMELIRNFYERPKKNPNDFERDIYLCNKIHSHISRRRDN